MSTISKQILELQTLPAAQLVARYTELFGKEPRAHNRAWLFRQCAFRLQERELGGLGERAKTRLDALIAEIDLPLRDAPPPRPRALPRRETSTPVAGTMLVREYRGQQIRVEVRDNEFIWNGISYGSLSAVAKAVTGASWSGALFFGLRQRSTPA